MSSLAAMPLAICPGKCTRTHPAGVLLTICLLHPHYTGTCSGTHAINVPREEVQRQAKLSGLSQLRVQTYNLSWFWTACSSVVILKSGVMRRAVSIDSQVSPAQRLWGAGTAVQRAAGGLGAGHHRLQAVGHGARGVHGHQAHLPGAAGRPQAQDGRLRAHPGRPLRGALLVSLAKAQLATATPLLLLMLCGTLHQHQHAEPLAPTQKLGTAEQA